VPGALVASGVRGQVSEAAIRRSAGEPRVSLGVPELDQMLDGGLMPHRPYLIVGPSGTGKTTLALQFLCEGVRRGEKGLYVTVEDPPNEVVWNHRALRPALDAIDVFDAIPDVMRYERAPFKDISAVREVLPFGRIPDTIRQTPEFTSVEITGTALEQMLRSEVQKRGYSRLVIDSLTALQYFCMKGFDPILGAQTFLRFLTDLRTTTLLTVEAPLEDVETPERMLARGEIRLFRWELEGVTVRAVGVEKMRGSAHDVRLHPYRIGARGIDIQLAQTISRDTRQVVEPMITVSLREEPPQPKPAVPTVVAVVAPPEPLSAPLSDLVALGVDVTPLRGEVEAALAAVRASRLEEVTARLSRISAMTISLAPLAGPPAAEAASSAAALAFQRLSARADRIREGKPPTQLPPLDALARELASLLEIVPAPPAPPPAVTVSPPAPTVPSGLPAAASPSPVSEVAPAPPAASAPEAAPAASPPPARMEAGEPPLPPSPVAPRGAARRRPRVAEPSPPPPPLPKVATLPVPPTLPSSPSLTEPPRAAPAPPPPPAVPAAPPEGPAPVASPELVAPAAPPKRRRRAASAKSAQAPAAPATEAPAAEGAEKPVTPKPRKRVVRRKKAPTVVSASAVVPPSEPTAAPSPGPTEATAPTPAEAPSPKAESP